MVTNRNTEEEVKSAVSTDNHTVLCIPSFLIDNAETNVFIGSNIPSFLFGWSSFPFLFCSVYFMEVMESRGQRTLKT